MNARPRSGRIDAAQRESEACSGRLIPTRSSRTSFLRHGRAVVSPKARDSQVRSNGQDDVGERASLVPVSGKAHPGGWARNWARGPRHREAMEMARSGEVGGLDRASRSGDPDRRRLVPGRSWSHQPPTTFAGVRPGRVVDPFDEATARQRLRPGRWRWRSARNSSPGLATPTSPHARPRSPSSPAHRASVRGREEAQRWHRSQPNVRSARTHVAGPPADFAVRSAEPWLGTRGRRGSPMNGLVGT